MLPSVKLCIRDSVQERANEMHAVGAGGVCLVSAVLYSELRAVRVFRGGILKGQGFTLSEIGTHAGLDDTSLMLALDPSLVREDRLSNGSKFGSAEGVYGDPSKASARLGILGVDAIVFQR
jgi:creatinine amidohydrolase/Fe(II)-dependent formamide hydrolase-like protein